LWGRKRFLVKKMWIVIEHEEVFLNRLEEKPKKKPTKERT